MGVLAGSSAAQEAPTARSAGESGCRALTVSRIASLDAFAGRADEWNALLARSHTKTIFQTYEFHAAWWKTFGAEYELLLLVAEADDTLVGIAPLVLAERSLFGWRRRLVQFMGARLFDYTDFIVDRSRPDVLPVLLRKLLELETPFDGLYLRDIPEGSPTRGVARSFFRSCGHIVDVRFQYEAPARVFGDPAADRQVLAKKSLKRHYNGLRKLGHVEFVNCTTAEQAFAFLGAFFDQHVRRRAPTDTPSVFLDERMRVFFEELVTALAPPGWLLFSVVLLDRRPVAMHFGFEFGGCITWYKPAFELELARYSPGEVLIRYLLEYAIERGATELDFTIGAEPFKYRFANVRRANYAVRVYRSRLPHLADRLILWMRGLLERYPPAARAARRALTRLRNQAWF